MLKKYGVEHYSKTDEFKNLNVERYGVKSTLELDYVKEKSKITMNERYGVDYYSKSEEYIKKINNTCNKKYGVDHYSKTDEFKDKIRNSVLKNKILKNEINIIDYQDNFFKAKCKKEHIYLIDRCTLKNRLKYKTEICTICNPIGSFSNSGYEKLFQDFIKENCNNISYNQRNIISPLELDIYIPELKLAFEFNGLYWHNEINKEDSYHLNKTEECEKQGIQLIHIWEDDWLYKNEIVKSMILNKLGKNKNSIYARKCEIREVKNNKLLREFLNTNHIQGFIGSNEKIGLFYNDELVSLMILGNRRVAMGKKSTNKGEYELLRFCNKLNYSVIGGASKLFKYFIEKYKPVEVITYADRSFSQGELYKTLGFNFISKTEPNYYYIIDGIRKHRFNFRKDRLIKQDHDSNKTEHEIMIDRKIYRIYDSGNLKFMYNKKII